MGCDGLRVITPAFRKTRSTSPARAVTYAAAVFHASRLVTSQATNVAPVDSTSALRVSPARSNPKTMSPRSTRRATSAFPRPEAAPVTIAVRDMCVMAQRAAIGT